MKKWGGNPLKSTLWNFISKGSFMKAVLNNEIIAQCDNPIELEGNYYFPPDSVVEDFLVMSSTRTTCPWKGEATYYDIIIDGKQIKDAAWSYHEPSADAYHIKDCFAFWRGVRITP